MQNFNAWSRDINEMIVLMRLFAFTFFKLCYMECYNQPEQLNVFKIVSELKLKKKKKMF